MGFPGICLSRKIAGGGWDCCSWRQGWPEVKNLTRCHDFLKFGREATLQEFMFFFEGDRKVVG